MPFCPQKEAKWRVGLFRPAEQACVNLSLFFLFVRNNGRVSRKQRGLKDHSRSVVLKFVFWQLNPSS